MYILCVYDAIEIQSHHHYIHVCVYIIYIHNVGEVKKYSTQAASYQEEETLVHCVA